VGKLIIIPVVVIIGGGVGVVVGLMVVGLLVVGFVVGGLIVGPYVVVGLVEPALVSEEVAVGRVGKVVGALVVETVPVVDVEVGHGVH
jgi:hypothetical protein